MVLMVLELLGDETVAQPMLMSLHRMLLPAAQRMLQSRLQELMTIMRQSWHIRLCLRRR